MDRVRDFLAAARRSIADKLAIAVSFACLVHCLLLPVAVALIPAAGGLAELPESLHLMTFAVALPISAAAIVAGYRRHGALLPGAVAGIGLGLIGIGAIAGFAVLIETSVTVLGSLLLAAAHLVNWRSRLRAASGSPA
ncbi:MAG: MerC domain-containing protein [Pseudomonadota bacterium]|nr:MerC domain-containing protein [Pseudomonadota bacterium]